MPPSITPIATEQAFIAYIKELSIVSDTLTIEDIAIQFDFDFNAINAHYPLSSYRLIFKNVIFEKRANFGGAVFKKEAYFFEAKFFGKADFEGAVFKKEAYFFEAKFFGKADFEGAVFKKEAYFSGATFKEKVNFSWAKFKEKAIFFEAKFFGEVIFLGATFEKEADFLGATFEKEANFWEVRFEKEAYFRGAEFFGEADFSRAKFKEKAIFFEAKFFGEVIFLGATFEKEADFLGATFEKEANFWEVRFDKNPQFNNLILGQESHIHFRQLNQKQPIQCFHLTNTIINGRVDFNHAHISTLDMKGTVVAGVLSWVQCTPTCANWETATLLKNEELKQNNIVMALQYKAEEKDLYTKYLKLHIILKEIAQAEKCIQIYKHINENYFLFPETMYEINSKITEMNSKIKKMNLKIEDFKNKELPEIIKNTPLIRLQAEEFSLWLSKISNNHGQNWLQGLFFTMGCLFCCFGIFYLPSPFQGIHNHLFTKIYWQEIAELFLSGQFFAEMIQYFSPTNYQLLIEYCTNPQVNLVIKFGGVLIYIAGKILVPYGVFEIVQAFRKYNKIGY